MMRILYTIAIYISHISAMLIDIYDYKF